MNAPHGSADRGPGVPEAIPRGLQFLWSELGPQTMDRIWIFPPLVSGRTERGLLAVSRYADGNEPDRRVLLTLPYSAERSGKGLVLDRSLDEQGEAPLDRLPRVMEGVVHRAESDLGEPSEVVVEGSEEKLRACLEEFESGLLDPELPPLRAETTVESEGPEEGGVEVAESTGSVLEELTPPTDPGASPDDDVFDLYAGEPAS